MKKIFLALIGLVAFINISNAQNDTMYVMKNGAVAGKHNVNNQVDSVVLYQSAITPGNTFTDPRDGTVYQTVTIGNQIWMAENLKYLPSVVGPGTGSSLKPYYYVYVYDGTDVNAAKATSNYTTYGVLYNWPAAMAGSSSRISNPSGVQGVCPTGWHLPSDAEWTELTVYLGGESVAGGKLKEIGTTHWSGSNTNAVNETGFTALPGGYRDYDGAFYGVGYDGYWWSATGGNAMDAWNRGMNCDYSSLLSHSGIKELGISVRCVRD